MQFQPFSINSLNRSPFYSDSAVSVVTPFCARLQPLPPSKRLEYGQCCAVFSAVSVVLACKQVPRRGKASTALWAKQRAREGKPVGNAVWIDLTLSMPLGLSLTDNTNLKGVFVDEIRDGGSVATHNEKYILNDDPIKRLHWIQTGDQLLMVNGTPVTSTAQAVELITGSEDPQNVQLKFGRDRSGNVMVIFPEDSTRITASPNMQVAAAAQMAGHGVQYGCTDGTCGTCWRKDYDSDEIYILCLDDITVGKVPSKTVYNADADIFWDEAKEREMKENRAKSFFDNTEPLILKSCPADYQLWIEKNPVAAAVSDATRTRLGVSEPVTKDFKWGLGKSWSGFD